MASAVGSSDKGGRRRSLDSEVNLVPFIDLLSMCICFLLMTAIWVEVGSVQVKQMLGTSAAAVTTEAIDLEVKMKEDSSLDLVVEKGGRAIETYKLSGVPFAEQISQLNNRVSTIVNALGGDAANPPNITARVIPSKLYPYSDLVTVLDTLKGSGVSQLAVVPVKE